MSRSSDHFESAFPSAKRRRLQDLVTDQRSSSASAPESVVYQNSHRYNDTSLCDNATAQFGDIHHNHYYASTESDQVSVEMLSRSLRFDRMDARLNSIRTALSKTCAWLFDHKDFVAWQDDSRMLNHHGFFWIKGKPGSGKSTIMKLAYERAKRQRPSTIVISYFFNARASGALEKSGLGLYRSLVHQLLAKVPVLHASFLERFRTKEKDGVVEDWTADELQEFILDALTRSDAPAVQIFVDALDEGDEDDIRRVIMFLEQLAYHVLECGGKVRICLSSRFYPHISIRHGLELVVEDQLEHGRDIQHYISRRLHGDQSEEMQNLRFTLFRKAAGIFLWVTLVIPILSAKFDKGGEIETVAKYLETIPSELNSLFADILAKNTEDIETCVIVLQWVLFSKRALNISELYQMAQHVHNQAFTGQTFQSVEQRHAELFLLNCSRGLVEFTNSEPPTAQFIHETVRGFLLTEGGLAQVAPRLAENVSGLSHDMLKETCYEMIQVTYSTHYTDLLQEAESNMSIKGRLKAVNKKLACDLRKDHSLLCYAVDNILHHANAAQSDSCSQETFLLSFTTGTNQPLANWRILHNCLAHHASQSYSIKASIWYIVADKNFPALAQCLSERFSHNFDEIGERYGTPLQAACANGHRDIVEVLLRHGANINSCSGAYRHALAAALQRQHWQIANLLCERGAALPYNLAVKLLYNACNQGKEQTVKFLLDMDLPADACYHSSCRCHEAERMEILMQRVGMCGNITPLCMVSRKGNVVLAKMLLSHGADINKVACRGSPVYHALLAGKQEFFHAMVDAGADIFIDQPGKDKMLSIAAFQGQFGVVRYLLERGFDINATTSGFGTALHASVESGNIDLVKFLLNMGARIDALGGIFGTVLQASAQARAKEENVPLLLDRGADIHIVGGEYGTALHAAAAIGREARVRLLLDRGAAVDVICGRYGTVLHAASASGNIAVIRLLLERGANINAVEGCYGSELSAAVYYGRRDVIQALIDYGADVNLPASHHKCPLEAAQKNNSLDVVEILLAAGARLPE